MLSELRLLQHCISPIVIVIDWRTDWQAEMRLTCANFGHCLPSPLPPSDKGLENCVICRNKQTKQTNSNFHQSIDIIITDMHWECGTRNWDDTYQQTKANQFESQCCLFVCLSCFPKPIFTWSVPICAFIVNIRIKYCLLNVYAFSKSCCHRLYMNEDSTVCDRDGWM